MPKWRYTVGTETPASRATAGIDALASPPVMTRTVASRIRWRVSSACRSRSALRYSAPRTFGNTIHIVNI